MVSPAEFFFVSIILATQDILYFHMSFNAVFSFSVKIVLRFWWGLWWIYRLVLIGWQFSQYQSYQFISIGAVSIFLAWEHIHCFLHSFKFFVVYIFHLSLRSIPKNKSIQTTVNGIIFLISFLIYLALEHRKRNDLPNLLMMSSDVFMSSWRFYIS